MHRYLLPLMWIGRAACWLAASLKVNATARREPLASRLQHIVPLGLAVVVLALPRLPVPVLGERMFPAGVWPSWLGPA